MKIIKNQKIINWEKKETQADLRHLSLVFEAKRQGSDHTGYHEFAFEIQTQNGTLVLKLNNKQLIIKPKLVK